MHRIRNKKFLGIKKHVTLMNQLTTNEDYMVPMELSYLLLPFILRSVCK